MNTARDARALPFHSGLQRARVCCALLARVDAADRWTPSGPALAARAVPTRRAEPDAERMLALCWALWEGSSTLSLSELLLLQPSRLEAVGELIAALARGAPAVEAWLERFERPEPAGPAPGRRSAEARRLKVTR
jgi:hypothetical protein